MTNPTRNSIIMFFAFVIGALLIYAYNISMGWLLTPEQYGMLGVSLSFLLIMSLFVTSAFPLTVTKFISGKQDEPTKHRVFKSALVANIIIAVKFLTQGALSDTISGYYRAALILAQVPIFFLVH